MLGIFANQSESIVRGKAHLPHHAKNKVLRQVYKSPLDNCGLHEPLESCTLYVLDKVFEREKEISIGAYLFQVQFKRQRKTLEVVSNQGSSISRPSLLS